MNKFILFIFLSISFSIYSQKNEIITIDPFGINEYPSEKFRYEKTVKFKIKNVNVFKINGTLKATGETPVFEIPQVFIQNEEIKQDKDSIEELREQKINGKKDDFLESYISLEKKMLSSKNNFLNSKQNFISNLQKINGYISFKEQLQSQLQDSIFIRDTNVVKNNAKAYYKVLFEEDNVLSNLNEVNSTINELLENYSEMKFNYNTINKTLKPENLELSGELKATDKKTVFKVEKAKVKIEREKMFEKEMAYAGKLRDSLVKPETQKMIKEKVTEGLSLYQKIINEKFEVYTDSYQLLDDVVTLTPELKDSKGKVVHKFNPYQIKTRGKWKVNFSSGYFLSFVGDEKFSYTKDSIEIVGVKKIKTDKVTHALGGMIHTYMNSRDGFQPAFSAGLSVNSKGSLGFYGGLSFLFTEKNRMVFTAGYSFTKVNVLDTGNLDEELMFTNKNDLEIKYNNVYRGAVFISLTYNLSEPKKN